MGICVRGKKDELDMIDLEKLDLKELKALKAELDKTINGFEERKRKEALLALHEQAKSLGFSLEELTGARVAKQRKAAISKYAHPENKNITWSGRGRKPSWFVEALKAGKTADELAV
jgi:DNA-binding protein H-NS